MAAALQRRRRGVGPLPWDPVLLPDPAGSSPAGGPGRRGAQGWPLQLWSAGGGSGAAASRAACKSGRPYLQYGWAGAPLEQMICPAPVTAAMAAVRVRDSLNEDTFRETYSLHPSTADYNSLHQITSDYGVITFSYSFITSYYIFIRFNTSYYSLVLLHGYFVITKYYFISLHSLLHITAEVTPSLLPITYLLYSLLHITHWLPVLLHGYLVITSYYYMP